MDFTKEESYPCKGEGCDKVFYVKEDLEKHAKVHEKEMRRKNHCCLHCNKTISRAQNLKLHQQTCERNENWNTYRRIYGVDADVHNGGFILVESAFKKTVVLYRKQLDGNVLQQLGGMELLFSQDVKNLLQTEVVRRKGMKWSLALKAIMYKPSDPDVVTDPPAVFNTNMKMGVVGRNWG